MGDLLYLLGENIINPTFERPDLTRSYSDLKRINNPLKTEDITADMVLLSQGVRDIFNKNNLNTILDENKQTLLNEKISQITEDQIKIRARQETYDESIEKKHSVEIRRDVILQMMAEMLYNGRPINKLEDTT